MRQEERMTYTNAPRRKGVRTSPRRAGLPARVLVLLLVGWPPWPSPAEIEGTRAAAAATGGDTPKQGGLR